MALGPTGPLAQPAPTLRLAPGLMMGSALFSRHLISVPLMCNSWQGAEQIVLTPYLDPQAESRLLLLEHTHSDRARVPDEGPSGLPKAKAREP